MLIIINQLLLTIAIKIGCNSQVNLNLSMSGKLLENYPQYEKLLGTYISTKNNQSINHWINENNEGIWKDVQANKWCIGYIPKEITNSDNCEIFCTCILRNPSIVNCPHEKMMLAWEHEIKFGKWEEVNSEDLQIKPKLGNAL